MRVLVLVDGLHSKELFSHLSQLIPLEGTEILLAFVRSSSPRAGLELIRRRPGGHHLPPERAAELSQAEVAAAADALAEAGGFAHASGASVEMMQLTGEPGRAICEVAATRHIDLVVVRAGGRDRPPLGPASLGPVARFVTDHCVAPVLLLRELHGSPTH